VKNVQKMSEKRAKKTGKKCLKNEQKTAYILRKTTKKYMKNDEYFKKI
jgi:hypothetical protein